MWSENKVRIKDIAEELGLSTATVSNVLHGKTQKISDRTVKAVEQKLEERGYIPDMAATLLARNNSRIIGVVVNDHPKYEGHVFEDSFISAAINYLSDETEANGYFMMLKKAKKITEIVAFASMWNLDGVVLIMSESCWIKAFITSLSAICARRTEMNGLPIFVHGAKTSTAPEKGKRFTSAAPSRTSITHLSPVKKRLSTIVLSTK